MPSPMVTIRAARGLDAELAARGDQLGAVAYRDLRRYYDSLRLATLRTACTVSAVEMDIIQSVLADRPIASAADAAELPERIAAKGHRAFQASLLADKLYTLSPFERLAICDHVERWLVDASRDAKAT